MNIKDGILRMPSGLKRPWWAAVASLAVATVGCGVLGPPPGDPIDGNRDPSVQTAVGRTSGEPNDDFPEALVAVFDASGSAALQGVIFDPDDIDVYTLGPLFAGDRIIVDVDTAGGSTGLDVSIALFDAEQNLFLDNDDAGGSLDSFIDEIIRHDSDPYYLLIGPSAFATPSQRTGSYSIDIRVIPDNVVPAPRGQTVFLDFDGGTVSVDSLGVSEIPPFSADEIHPRYAGRTDFMKSVIVDSFRENFEGLDLTVVTSDEVEVPSPDSMIVMFGGFHPPELDAFGVSEQVDHFNADPGDTAVIFTEAFRPHVFSEAPSAEELGVAIGNIAAHEAGHLLGMNHIDDPLALMDAVSPADTFLDDQEFKRGPLFEPEFFPIGYQDAFALLSEILGLL